MKKGRGGIMNLAILSGNVVKDAKLFSTSEGKVCCVSRLAVRDDKKPREKLPTFVDFVIWGNRAEKISSFVTQGRPVSITGRLDISKSVKEEKTFINTRIIVDNIEFLGKKNYDTPDAQEPQQTQQVQQTKLDTQGENS
jgi:single-strand DNA-binding protein